MTDHSQPAQEAPAGTFTKAFVPGLVLGLIIGAFAGVAVSEFWGAPNLPERTGPATAGVHENAHDRDEGPASHEDGIEAPETPEGEPSANPPSNPK